MLNKEEIEKLCSCLQDDKITIEEALDKCNIVNEIDAEDLREINERLFICDLCGCWTKISEKCNFDAEDLKEINERHIICDYSEIYEKNNYKDLILCDDCYIEMKLIMPYEDFKIVNDSFLKYIKNFQKDCVIYYTYIEPKLSKLEVTILANHGWLEISALFKNKINVSFVNGIPDDINKGHIGILDNLLLVIDTDEIIEHKDQTNNIQKCLQKLNNQKFLDNASEDVVNLERKKYQDFTNIQDNYMLNVFFNRFGRNFLTLIEYYYTLERIYYHIEYYREINYVGEEYTDEWFKVIYGKDITDEEFNHLLELCIYKKIILDNDNNIQEIIRIKDAGIIDLEHEKCLVEKYAEMKNSSITYYVCCDENGEYTLIELS